MTRKTQPPAGARVRFTRAFDHSPEPIVTVAYPEGHELAADHPAAVAGLAAGAAEVVPGE